MIDLESPDNELSNNDNYIPSIQAALQTPLETNIHQTGFMNFSKKTFMTIKVLSIRRLHRL